MQNRTLSGTRPPSDIFCGNLAQLANMVKKMPMMKAPLTFHTSRMPAAAEAAAAVGRQGGNPLQEHRLISNTLLQHLCTARHSAVVHALTD
jgi:hypothetical protein